MQHVPSCRAAAAFDRVKEPTNERNAMHLTTETTTCQFVILDPGPHPGCSEFDPDPGTFECANEATVAIVTQADPFFPGDEVILCCAEHAADIADDPDVVRLIDLATGEVHDN